MELSHFIFSAVDLFRCKNDFGYLRLLLVCFTKVGDLQPIFKTRYDIFLRITINVYHSCYHTFMEVLYHF